MGPQGEPGLPGEIGYADFYALMPPDNAATVAPVADVAFPQDGLESGIITRISDTSFALLETGVYMVFSQVGVTEPGQLALTLYGEGIASSVVGRATGTSQIVGMSIIEAGEANATLTVRNPAGNTEALTITPLAGGTNPVSAHLTILELA